MLHVLPACIKRTAQQKTSSVLKKKFVFVFMLLSFMLAACGGQRGTTFPESIYAPYRPYRVVQVCFDSSKTYPRYYIQGAGKVVAAWLNEAVTPNQDGLVAYANITSKPADPAQYTVTTVSIPKIMPDPARPALIPIPKDGPNPFDKSKQKKVEQQNQQALSTWATATNTNHQHIQEALATVKTQTEALAHLSPSNTSSDYAGLVGCANVGAMRFANTKNAKHILILASDLSNPNAPSQVTFFPLYGADVWVIYRYCQQVSSCPAADTTLRTALLAAGASSVHILDAAESQVQASPL